MVDVVLPTPPFWLHIAMTFAGPCDVLGLGFGNVRGGRPVRPPVRVSQRRRRRCPQSCLGSARSGPRAAAILTRAPPRESWRLRGVANIRESLTGRMGSDRQTRCNVGADSNRRGPRRSAMVDARLMHLQAGASPREVWTSCSSTTTSPRTCRIWRASSTAVGSAMALSWSPTMCASRVRRSTGRTCISSRARCGTPSSTRPMVSTRRCSRIWSSSPSIGRLMVRRYRARGWAPAQTSRSACTVTRV